MAKKAGDDALDIAVHDSRLPVKRDGSDSRGGIIADAGKLLQAFFRIRKDAAMFIRHGFRAFLRLRARA